MTILRRIFPSYITVETFYQLPKRLFRKKIGIEFSYHILIFIGCVFKLFFVKEVTMNSLTTYLILLVA